jgi:hypothetical protein
MVNWWMAFLIIYGNWSWMDGWMDGIGEMRRQEMDAMESEL